MKNLRYPEKDYLMEYDLSFDFFEKLDLEIKEVIPLRKVFILNTNKGRKILKKIDYSEERFNIINSNLQKIKKYCPNIIEFNEISEGRFVIDIDKKKYVLMDLIEGREVTFTNPIEFKMTAEFLGNFHKASKKVLEEISNFKPEEPYYKKIERAIGETKEIKEWVMSYKYKNEFDEIFLSKADEYLIEMEEAKEYLVALEDKYGDEINKDLVICHNDLAEHNFIIKDNEIYLIDFDYMSIDIKATDIADFLLKGIKNNAYDLNKGKDALIEYKRNNTISNFEYEYIYALIKFPRDFYSLVKSYYKKQKNWNYDIFLNRLNNKIINDEFRKEFLEDYKK